MEFLSLEAEKWIFIQIRQQFKDILHDIIYLLLLQ